MGFMAALPAIIGAGAGLTGGLLAPKPKLTPEQRYWQEFARKRANLLAENSGGTRGDLYGQIANIKDQPGYSPEEAASLGLTPEEQQAAFESDQERANSDFSDEERRRAFLDPEYRQNLYRSNQELQWMDLSPEEQQGLYLTPEEQRNQLLSADSRRAAQVRNGGEWGLTTAEQNAQYRTPEEIAAGKFTDRDISGLVSLAQAPIAGAADKGLTLLESRAAARGGYAPGMNAAAEQIAERAGQQGSEAALAARLGAESYNKGAAERAAEARTGTAGDIARNRQTVARELGLNEQQTNQFLALNDQEAARYLAANRQRTTAGITSFRKNLAAQNAADRIATERGIQLNDQAVRQGLDATSRGLRETRGREDTRTRQNLMFNRQEVAGDIARQRLAGRNLALSATQNLHGSDVNELTNAQSAGLASSTPGQPASPNWATGLASGIAATVPYIPSPKPKPTGNAYGGYGTQPYGPPSYDKGGPVRKTGLALVHKGEFVVPRKKVKQVPHSLLAAY